MRKFVGIDRRGRAHLLNELADRIHGIMLDEKVVVYCHQRKRSCLEALILIKLGLKKNTIFG